MEREPVRLAGYTALVVGLLLLAVIGWAFGADFKTIVGQVAAVALSSIGGLEFARHQVTPVAAPVLDDGHGDEK
jgi:hypothetical protein